MRANEPAMRAAFPDVAVSVQLAADPMTVMIPAPLVVHLCANIIRNAAQAARNFVRITVTGDGADAVVTVDDDGPGIQEADRERAFRRFERLAGGRAAGTGLGLVISAAITRVASGSITIGDAVAGSGCRFAFEAIAVTANGFRARFAKASHEIHALTNALLPPTPPGWG